MTKKIATLLFLSFCLTGFSQEKEIDFLRFSKIRKKEIRFNPLIILISNSNPNLATYGIEYQRAISKNESIGICVSSRFALNTTIIYVGDPISETIFVPDLTFLPYYRRYLFEQKKYAASFFVKAQFNLSYFKHRHQNEDLTLEDYHNSWGFGAGSSVGSKTIFNNNIALEIVIGGGISTQTIFYSKSGVILGYHS